jgi:hypothetical protein
MPDKSAREIELEKQLEILKDQYDVLQEQHGQLLTHLVTAAPITLKPKSEAVNRDDLKDGAQYEMDRPSFGPNTPRPKVRLTTVDVVLAQRDAKGRYRDPNTQALLPDAEVRALQADKAVTETDGALVHKGQRRLHFGNPKRHFALPYDATFHALATLVALLVVAWAVLSPSPASAAAGIGNPQQFSFTLSTNTSWTSSTNDLPVDGRPNIAIELVVSNNAANTSNTVVTVDRTESGGASNAWQSSWVTMSLANAGTLAASAISNWTLNGDSLLRISLSNLCNTTSTTLTNYPSLYIHYGWYRTSP